MKTVPCQDSVV